MDPEAQGDCHATSVVWTHGLSGAEGADNPQNGPVWYKNNCNEGYLQLEVKATGPRMGVLWMGFHEFRMTNGVCLYWDARLEDITEAPGGDWTVPFAALRAEVEGLRGEIGVLRETLRSAGREMVR
jgi:hypothetical protein